MKRSIIFVSMAIAAGMTLTNIYTSIVDVPSWGGNIPHSIETAREYFKTVNAGNFFRIFSPANQVAGLLALILFWKVSATARIYLGLALALYVCADVLTFAYFYPRNAIIFEKGSLTDIDTLKNALNGWRTMNWVRSFVVFAGLVFSFMALNEIYNAK